MAAHGGSLRGFGEGGARAAAVCVGAGALRRGAPAEGLDRLRGWRRVGACEAKAVAARAGGAGGWARLTRARAVGWRVVNES